MEVNSLKRVSIYPLAHRKPHRQSLASKLWDKKTRFLKNKAEKLLITKDRPSKTNRNEPENEAEKLLKTRSSVKNEPKTNRKIDRAILLKTKKG